MKSLITSITLLIAMSSAFAANIRDLDVGDGMYLQGILSDELVYVVRVDHSYNRVKVRRSEDGTTKWVSASDLISRESSNGNDFVRGAVAVGLLVCLTDPESCQNNNNRSSNSRYTQANYSRTNASSTGYKFKITNNCRHPVNLAMHYKTVVGSWSTNGWWTVRGNASRYLTFDDGSYATSNSSTFYYYAKFNDGSYVWEGKYKYAFNGDMLPMRKAEDKEGDSEWAISCPGK